MKNFDLVIGTGQLGKAVAKELLQIGKTVKMVNSKGSPIDINEIEILKCNASLTSELKECCKGAQVVYHCAAPPYNEWPEKFPSLTKSISESAMLNDCKLVFGDNLYCYGEIIGSIHENLPNAAKTKKGKIRTEVSKTLMSLHTSGKLPVTIGRASDFFGPNVLNSVMGDRVFPQAINGARCTAYGNVDLPHTYTYIKDFAKGLTLLGDNDKSYGEIWHIPNSKTITTRQFIEIIYQLCKYTPKIGIMRKTTLRLGGLFIPAAKEMIEMLYEFEKPFVVDSNKFVNAFGNISTPVENAIEETIEWFKIKYGQLEECYN